MNSPILRNFFRRETHIPRFHVGLLFLLILVSAILHFYNISDPALAIFDERHFTTYAAKYALGEGVYDIHPPLGKWILSLPLRLYPEERVTPHEFVTVERNNSDNHIKTASNFIQEYGDFPYAPLRALTALFGVALVPLAYFFVLRLTRQPIAALAAALFITFENALLLNSRLILLDSMYLALSLAALVIFFHNKKPRPLLAGILWGLALGVKFTAIIFIGPILAHAVFHIKNFNHRKLLSNDWVRFSLAGGTVFLFVVFFFHNIILPVDKRMEAYKKVWQPWQEQNFSGKSIAWKYAAAGVFEIFSTLTGYTYGTPTSTLVQSAWYQWPLMQKPLPFVDSLRPITLTGNPIVWFSATAAVALVLLRIKRYRKKTEEHYPIWILFGGYVFSLLPFILIVRRDTYLYHYFPALIFGACLAAYLLTDYIGHHRAFKKRKIAAAVTAVVVAGFLVSAPYTYGFLVPTESPPIIMPLSSKP